MTPETLNIILLITPLAIGGTIAAVNTDGVNETTEKIEAATRRRQQITALNQHWFSKRILNPILLAIVKFSDWTDGFTHRGLKNGVRVAAALYLIAAWLFILYTVFMIVAIVVIALVLLNIVFKILINSDKDVKRGYDAGRGVFNSSRQRKDDVMDNAGLRGQKIYSGTNWFNEELKGRVDDEGNIYKGTNWFNEEKIGRIGNDGNIYKGTNLFNEERVGRIDEDGNLNKGTNWFNEEKIGRIDEDGNIHKGTNWFNEEKTGRTGN